MDLHIRRGNLDDLAGLVASSAALFAEDAGTRDPTLNQDWPRREGPQAFRELIDDPGRLCLVADDSGVVVGHLSGAMRPPVPIRPLAVAELISMYVRPAYRRLELGGQLVEVFFDWARKQGAARASVSAYASNEGAIRFYQRQGFEPRTVILETDLSH